MTRGTSHDRESILARRAFERADRWARSAPGTPYAGTLSSISAAAAPKKPKKKRGKS